MEELQAIYAPDPRLRESPPDVVIFDDELKVIVDKMIDFMQNVGAVGLAANQVGINKRIAIVSDDDGIVYPAINLRVEDGWGERFVPEGCLSLPGIVVMKRRPIDIFASWHGLHGIKRGVLANNFFAQVICHEADHLDGRLMTDEDDRVWHKLHGGV